MADARINTNASIARLLDARSSAHIPSKIANYETPILDESTYLHPDDIYLLSLVFRKELNLGEQIIEPLLEGMENKTLYSALNYQTAYQPMTDNELQALVRENKHFKEILKSLCKAANPRSSAIIVSLGKDAENTGHFINVNLERIKSSVTISIDDSFTPLLSTDEKANYETRLQKLFSELLKHRVTVAVKVNPIQLQKNANCGIHAVVNKINFEFNLKLNARELVRSFRKGIDKAYDKNNINDLGAAVQAALQTQLKLRQPVAQASPSSPTFKFSQSSPHKVEKNIVISFLYEEEIGKDGFPQGYSKLTLAGDPQILAGLKQVLSNHGFEVATPNPNTLSLLINKKIHESALTGVPAGYTLSEALQNIARLAKESNINITVSPIFQQEFKKAFTAKKNQAALILPVYGMQVANLSNLSKSHFSQLIKDCNKNWKDNENLSCMDKFGEFEDCDQVKDVLAVLAKSAPQQKTLSLKEVEDRLTQIFKNHHAKFTKNASKMDQEQKIYFAELHSLFQDPNLSTILKKLSDKNAKKFQSTEALSLIRNLKKNLRLLEDELSMTNQSKICDNFTVALKKP